MGAVRTDLGPLGVAVIRLDNAGRRNAIDVSMFVALQQQIADLYSTLPRVVILTGHGADFSSGADLRDPARPDWDHLDYMRLVNRAVNALHDLPMPTIAAVRGVAAGIGCNLALGCDLVVAADDARFSEIFVRRGLSVDGGGSWLLPRLLGMHKAMEIVLFGEELTASDALAVGLVNRVVASDHLDAFVSEWAERLASGPSFALSTSKALVRNGASVSFADALEAEAVAQVVNVAHGEGSEAIAAFVERRTPRWRPWHP